MMSFQHLKEQIYDIDNRRQEESLLYLAEIVFSYAVSTLEDPCVQHWTLGYEHGRSDTPTTWKNERKLEKISDRARTWVRVSNTHTPLSNIRYLETDKERGQRSSHNR
jgi:hypothetical protein